ncbi:MAG: GNAT family N-acetyltransferase [Bacteroides sp.]|nr:GNAT family N-acetyltransferase [Bacteroides sp.]
MKMKKEVTDLSEITEIEKEEYPLLLPIWEASVRATHDFLKEEDLLYYKECIRQENFWQSMHIRVMRQEGNIVGFTGTDGDKLEVLFLHPSARGRGYGKRLLDDAVQREGICKVDVNEQNRQAVGFYLRYGFKQQSRSEQDGLGKPYPLLHLELPVEGE